MSAHGFDTILFLHWRLLRNWISRSARSPLFWVILIALGFVLLSMVASILGGGPADDLSDRVQDGHFEAATAAVFAISILIGVWRGASRTPRASLADVVVMMNSPVSARAKCAYMIIRDCAENGFVFSIWVTAGFGGLLVRTGDPWMPFRVFVVILVAVLLSEVLRYAVWTMTERVITSDVRLGNRIRQISRLAVMLATGALVGTLLLDVLAVTPGDWSAAIDVLVDRLGPLASFPPGSWPASLLIGDVNALLPAAGLVLLLSGVAGVALFNAREIVEPIAINAERLTDARGRVTEPGADIQWAAMSQIGAAPRWKVTVRPFGSGPWAILWASLVRWARAEIAAAWVGLLLLSGAGAIVAVLIRFEFMPVYAGWGLAVAIPLLSSVNSFLDELRKQFLFLTPGPAWQRLLAGAATSVLDGVIASLMVIVALVALRTVSLAQAAGLLLFCLALSVVAQGAVALMQVILPFWTPHQLRLSLTVVASIIAGTPALVVAIALYVVAGMLAAILIGSVIALAAGALMIGLTVLVFDHVELAD